MKVRLGDADASMRRDAADWVMIALGVISGVLLVLWGLSVSSNSSGTPPLFWVFVVAFLGYVGWDVLRHLRAIASRSASLERRDH